MTVGILSKLALIIPVFNEANGIKETINQVTSFVREMHPETKIYFVDDGSTDETMALLMSTVTPECKIVILRQNHGYGEALRQGARTAFKDGYEYCVFLDSDLTNPLADIPALIEPLTRYDFVKASRYIEGSSDHLVVWQRRLVSRFANIMFRFLFRTEIKDVSNGFRAWKLSEFVKLPGTSKGFDSIVEEFYYAKVNGLRIGESPTHLGNRDSTHRPTAASYSVPAIMRYLKWPLRYFFDSFKRKS
jgi:glycosyltransferase involved in cell wall biosynthesis